MQAAVHSRQCRQCGEPIRWSVVRLVGSRTFCSEPCAITWSAEEASRTAWNRTRLQLQRGSRGPCHWARVTLTGGQAWLAQRRLDRRLNAGPRAEVLPMIWLPQRRAAAGLLLVLAVWGITGGRSPETRAMVPIAPPPPVVSANGPSPPLPTVVSANVPSPTLPSVVHTLPPISEPVPPPLLASLPPAAPSLPAVPPRPRLSPEVPGDDVTRGSTTARQVAFTFDGGDQANVANEILDILPARSIRVTFFLTGQFIRMYPDLVRRMVAEGHEVGNHLDTHPHLTTYAQSRRQQTLPGFTRETLLGQLRRTEESFRALTGRALAPYWRAPYGEHNAEIRAWAAAAGYRHISWTRGAGTAEDLDTRDWVADRSSRIYRSREEIAARILEFGQGRPEGLNGGIVLMHLNSNRPTDRPHESLPEVLKTLQAQGYRLVTVSEMLGQAPPGPPSAVAGAPAPALPN